jgi:putative DNA methylase
MMSGSFVKTKPSFLEGGLPCATLSAECQRDNNARQRPPQNRLHIWWARRPPTISRAAILSALLPFDLKLDESVLPEMIPEPLEEDLENLPPKLVPHKAFFHHLLREVAATPLTREHDRFVRALGITGDAASAHRRMALRDEESEEGHRIPLPDSLVYRHVPANSLSPSSELVRQLISETRRLLQLQELNSPIAVLDSMAGGGVIPLEAVRFGAKVYANDLNPVAGLILKATIEYPVRFGRGLLTHLQPLVRAINASVNTRLNLYFTSESESTWWNAIDPKELGRLRSREVTDLAPGGDAITRDYLWLRLVPCSKCNLNIPISTNFHIVNKKGKPEAAIAAFPEVPERHKGNNCTFRIVKKTEWKDCRWPAPEFDTWHPRNTPTFKGGNAICPRCGNIMAGEKVKEIAKSRAGGLPVQMYAVCSQVPIKLTYTNGDVKVRYMWRFRAPTQKDLDAVRAAEERLTELLPKWEAQGLVPTEEIPEGDKTREPRNMGLYSWRDLFLPRQLLTNLTVLEEIRNAQLRLKQELPEDEAEAVSVYLAFILSKVVNYNSVNTFWDYTRNKGAQTFSRHDFAFRAAFTEFEGARETVMWGASQVLNAYDGLARLIHGEPVDLSNSVDDEDDGAEGLEESEDLEDVSMEVDDSGDEADPDEADHGARLGLLFANGEVHIRPEVIVPTITCEDAAALSTPEPGSVHLICVDPPYYKNVQYSELSNFFYVWLKRALNDWPGLAHLFHEPLAESSREAVANTARWQRDAARDLDAWQQSYKSSYEALRARKVKVKEAKERALELAGPKPLTAGERSDQFYEDKMASVFRRGKQLLHPAGRMVVMFNHKQTRAWRALGMALIRAGFEIRSSAPIHTEAESSLNIRGLDAARSTVLLLCLPREESEQPVGNWGTVQSRVHRIAQAAAERFQGQGLSGTDLYLSSLGPALGEVGKNWPVTDFAGRPIDLVDALDQAYLAVGQWRLKQIFQELAASPELAEAAGEFSTEGVDRDTQTLWLWLDTFQGETANSDDVRKLAKSLGVNPDDFLKMGLLEKKKDLFLLRPPQEIEMRLVSLRLKGVTLPRGAAAREADVWEERSFPGFIGAAVWNGIALMEGGYQGPRGDAALRRWLVESGYGVQREFLGAFAVTLSLLEKVFGRRPERDPWLLAARQARRGWDLVLKNWRI